MLSSENQAKQALTNYVFELDFSEFAENEGESVLLNNTALLAKISLDWVFYWEQEKSNNYKIQSKKSIYRLSKSKGKIDQALLHLIFRCQAKLPPIAEMLLPDLGIERQDPWLWFLTLLVEDIHHQFYQFKHSEKLRYKSRSRHKDSVIAAKRSYINQLAHLHDIHALIPTQFKNKRQFYKLVEELLYLNIDEEERLEKEIWDSYITAMREDLKYQQKSSHFVYGTIQNGKLIVNTGQGRGKRIKPLLKNHLQDS
ncbi:MAG: hypothetical protein VKL20_05950 [Synechocystis sp.]|nr:hypothetical protein [Synechocystis sp.]